MVSSRRLGCRRGEGQANPGEETKHGGSSHMALAAPQAPEATRLGPPGCSELPLPLSPS